MTLPFRVLSTIFLGVSIGANVSAQPAEFFSFSKYELPVRSHSGYHPNAVAFSADGRLMASGADDTIAVWDVKTQKLLTRMQYPKKQYSIQVVFSADGKSLISNGSSDTMLRLWDIRTGKQIQEIPKTRRGGDKFLSFVCFSPHGEFMLAGTDRDSVALVETASCKIKSELPGAQAGSWIGSAFSPDGSIVATGFSGPGKGMLTVALWDVKTGELIRKVGEQRPGWRNGYTLMTFSPDGKYIITASSGATRKTADIYYLTLWGVADGKRYCQFEARAGFNLAAMSKDARILVAHSMDRGGVRVFDLRENKELPTPVIPEQAAYNLSTAQDGATLVFLAGGGVVDSPTAVYLAPFPNLPQVKDLLELDDPMQKKLWDGLCGESEFQIQHVLAVFKQHAEQAVYLAKEKVQPMSLKRKQQVESWIKLFDDDSVDVRDMASADLMKVAYEFERMLTETAKNSAPGEVKNRLTRIVAKMHDPEEPLQLSAALRSDLAGIRLLKYLGTRDAKKSLEVLAAGASGTRLTDEAMAALKEMNTKKE